MNSTQDPENPIQDSSPPKFSDPSLQLAYEQIQQKADFLFKFLMQSLKDAGKGDEITLFDLGCLAGAILPKFYIDSGPQHLMLAKIHIDNLISIQRRENLTAMGLDPDKVILGSSKPKLVGLDGRPLTS